ncbi:MAG TPA: disulfide bond formation protein B [Acidimicrobiales bacterium]|nr:disulfide bond formation protein B [Acidimicrobiales bacterium]
MDAAQVADTFGAMAVMAVAIAVAAGVVAAAHPPGRERIRDVVDQHGATSAWLVAAIAMGGSLWFSEGANFLPCQLCWYQRIAMYPLVVVLGLRALRPGGSPDLRVAGLAIVGLGLTVNLWHVTIETWPSLDSGACAATVPCTVRWVEGLGFFTIPRLATVAFGLIGLLLLLDRTDRRGPATTPSPYDRPEIPLEGSIR